MSYTPHDTSQRDHRAITFCELVEACHDSSVLFQPAEHALDHVTLAVLGTIKQAGQSRLGFTLHRTQRNNRLHAVSVTKTPQCISVVALVSQKPTAALARSAAFARLDTDVIQQWLCITDIADLTARKEKAQGHAVGVAEHMNLGGEATAAAA